MKDNKAVFVTIAILILVLFSAGYVYLLKMRPPEVPEQKDNQEEVDAAPSDVLEDEHISVSLYFPDGFKLVREQRNIPRVFSQKKILKGAVQEFLRGPDTTEENIVPRETVLLGVFIGSDSIAYINLSEDFRRNFHGDVLDEFLLLKGMYETIISNTNVDDVKLLIEHKEVDSIGGHFFVDTPLKHVVTQEIKLD